MGRFSRNRIVVPHHIEPTEFPGAMRDAIQRRQRCEHTLPPCATEQFDRRGFDRPQARTLPPAGRSTHAGSRPSLQCRLSDTTQETGRRSLEREKKYQLILNGDERGRPHRSATARPVPTQWTASLHGKTSNVFGIVFRRRDTRWRLGRLLTALLGSQVRCGRPMIWSPRATASSDADCHGHASKLRRDEGRHAGRSDAGECIGQ